VNIKPGGKESNHWA